MINKDTKRCLFYCSGSLSLCILSDMIVNGISVLLIIYYPNVCSVYEIMGECLTGFSVLSIILSAACIYCLNRSLSIPAWQTSGDAGSEIHNVVIDE